ncbi:probable ECF sigma factor [Lentisphaera araneosa HTCC2155]|jgi:RNA polymerase sigma factor (sigma-70 family)|uniref:Probable ECF sigma factor n=1 Tax=Lentisphaera araneosa HTCC2155 TaxID=313628 RepID=A6DGN0_9BACT|nr:sigma-70 family RNA polymerase sigma factor [Lentisphaera araneosa]EDM29347.1 probable ECF sigma factor [Lentisphaera araneosa HTCC2155]
MSQNTRYTLLKKLQNDSSEKNWEEFVQYYSPYIFVIIRRFNVGAHDSEELLQDVLVKIWKNISKFDAQKYECRFRTWLGVMIRNTVFNFFKSKASRNSRSNVNYDDIIGKLELMTEAEVNIISEREWKNHIAKLAWEKLKASFSEQTQKVFEESIKSDISNAELATKFAISESSVRVFKMRVRKAMHKEIIRLNSELET